MHAELETKIDQIENSNPFMKRLLRAELLVVTGRQLHLALPYNG